MSALVSQIKFVKMVVAEESKTIIFQECDRQFIDRYTTRGYSNEVKESCLKMYLNGLGFRAVERVTGVNHNTVIRWVKKSALALPNAPRVEEIPEITEIDELQTNISDVPRAKLWKSQRLLLVKKNKIWLWTTANHWKPGILS